MTTRRVKLDDSYHDYNDSSEQCSDSDTILDVVMFKVSSCVSFTPVLTQSEYAKQNKISHSHSLDHLIHYRYRYDCM